jgi:hypothetical protein
MTWPSPLEWIALLGTLATFPEACPWPIEQVLDENFWPEG